MSYSILFVYRRSNDAESLAAKLATQRSDALATISITITIMFMCIIIIIVIIILAGHAAEEAPGDAEDPLFHSQLVDCMLFIEVMIAVIVVGSCICIGCLKSFACRRGARRRRGQPSMVQGEPLV